MSDRRASLCLKPFSLYRCRSGRWEPSLALHPPAYDWGGFSAGPQHQVLSLGCPSLGRLSRLCSSSSVFNGCVTLGAPL